MRPVRTVLTMVCSLAAATGFLAGCQTFESPELQAARLQPGADEFLQIDQIMILGDVTGSTGEARVFQQEKELLKRFTSIMPDLKYEMGIASFAGTDRSEWMRVSFRQGNPIVLAAAASHLEFLGGLTPLDQAVRNTGSEFAGMKGRAALVVFSDGRKEPHQDILDACKAVAANHLGEVCIYTVHVGEDANGRMLLQDMANTTSCGRAWLASEINSPEGMEEMVREIFFGKRAMADKMPEHVTLLGDVLFDLDKDILKRSGMEAVDLLVTRMKARPQENVLIEGHTCDRGTEAYNMDLSRRRANAVQAYMVQMGIAASRITTQAYGESRPAVPNKDETYRKLNRRAEFRFTAAN